MTVPLEQSPCKDCIFRGKNGRCSLIGVVFNERTGAFACYTLDDYTAEDLVRDIINYLREHPNVKSKEIAKHFGLSPQKMNRILERMLEAGVIHRKKWGKHYFYFVKYVSKGRLRHAIELVGKIYPQSSKGKFQGKNRRDILLSLSMLDSLRGYQQKIASKSVG